MVFVLVLINNQKIKLFAILSFSKIGTYAFYELTTGKLKKKNKRISEVKRPTSLLQIENEKI